MSLIAKNAAHAGLFSPLQVGAVTAPNRVFMAPLTRNRAHANGVPNAMAETYYAQRASAGLIITEATQISPMGKGYKDTPGIHAAAQIAAWHRITEAVHRAGGRIFLQLWHVGRISHVSLLPGGVQPVSSSAIRAETSTFTAAGFEPVSEPRALTISEIAATVEDYARAAHNAIAAGFDGVEIHAANGYLIDQFIRDSVNQRTDEYGGSATNRVRFLREVTEAVCSEIGARRTGVRLSPMGQFNAPRDSDPEATFGTAVDLLNTFGLAYLHFFNRGNGANTPADEIELQKRLRRRFDGPFIANGGFDAATAAPWIAAGDADAIAFGQSFIANPDLPERIAGGAELNVPDGMTFYGGNEKGYTDYPFMD